MQLQRILRAVEEGLFPCPNRECRIKFKSEYQFYSENGLKQHWERIHNDVCTDDHLTIAKKLLTTIHFDFLSSRIYYLFDPNSRVSLMLLITLMFYTNSSI